MTVLLSIKPQFASKIFAGLKKYEFRRCIFKRDVKRVVVYASAPISMVIGEFDIESVLHEDLDILWQATHAHAGISQCYFESYFSDKDKGYAIKIGEARLYSSPISLQENYGVSPPQSFLYLSKPEEKSPAHSPIPALWDC